MQRAFLLCEFASGRRSCATFWNSWGSQGNRTSRSWGSAGSWGSWTWRFGRTSLRARGASTPSGWSLSCSSHHLIQNPEWLRRSHNSWEFTSWRNHRQFAHALSLCRELTRLHRRSRSVAGCNTAIDFASIGRAYQHWGCSIIKLFTIIITINL